MDTYFTRQEWRSPDGKVTSLKTQTSDLSTLSEPVSRAVLGGSPSSSIAAAPAEGSYVRPLDSNMPTSDSFAHHLAGQPFDLTLHVRTRLIRPFLVAETTLGTPKSIGRDGYTLRIQQIDTSKEGELVLSVVQIFPPLNRPLIGAPVMFLIDPTSERVISVSESRGEQISVAGVSIGTRSATFRAAGLNAPATAAGPDSPATLSRFHLVYFDYELVDEVHRTARASKIAVGGK